MASKLIKENKTRLLIEFHSLRSIYGRRWPALLRSFNKWHNTAEGVYAWLNAIRGSTGNESLREIVRDMKSIVKNDLSFENKLVSPKKLAKIREDAIAKSLVNLTGAKPKKRKPPEITNDDNN